MKRKTLKRIENILGILSIASIIHWIVSLMIPLPYNIWGTDDFEVLMRNDVILWMGMSLVFCVFYFATNLKTHKLEPETIQKPSDFNNADDVLKYFDAKLSSDKYLYSGTPLSFPEGSVHLYYKQVKRNRIYCYTFMCADEIIAEDQLKEMESAITFLFGNYFKNDTMFIEINMVSVFCVNKNSQTLNELMSTELKQGSKNGRLNVSIPFDSENIYIARQESSMGISKYRDLHKRFFALMND